MKIPRLYTNEQRVAFAILCACGSRFCPTFGPWASAWMSGKDRTRETALRVSHILCTSPVDEARWMATRLAAIAEPEHFNAWDAEFRTALKAFRAARKARAFLPEHLMVTPQGEVDWAVKETAREALKQSLALNLDSIAKDVQRLFPTERRSLYAPTRHRHAAVHPGRGGGVRVHGTESARTSARILTHHRKEAP